MNPPSGRLLLTNKAHDEIWGGYVPADRIAQYDAFVAFHPDGSRYEPEDWPLSRALATGEVIHDEIIEILRFDAVRRITSQSAAPIYDEDGNLLAAVVTLQDVWRNQLVLFFQKKSAAIDAGSKTCRHCHSGSTYMAPTRLNRRRRS